ncbi:MAG: class I SAM-dependent methyltransferase [Ardenticatenaceae bacterium]|nr:class I SAM-dependent methyltransferase [Ardenticatenaceae bacterium]
MAVYDQQPGFALTHKVAEAYKKDIESVLGPFSQYQTVLEPGCGSGVFTAFLASQGLRVVGIDRDEAQLAAARERLPEVEFRLADLASDSKMHEHRFDLIANRYVIHELIDPIEIFASWRSLLAPNGRVVLIENAWIRTDWGWSDWGKRTDHLPLACTQTWATAAYCLQKAGFTVKTCSWMHHTNQLTETRLQDGFRLFIIVAEVPQ